MTATVTDSLSKIIFQGTLKGERRRGRQRKCWMLGVGTQHSLLSSGRTGMGQDGNKYTTLIVTIG